VNDRGRTPDRGPAPHDPFDSLLERVAKLSPVPSSVAARLHPGRALLEGRFQLVRQIGVGGMGIVYDAIDRERNGRVAIKTLSRLDASGIYRLKNEFRGLCEVLHPNLVRLHELFFEEGAWCFSMELVAGEPFDRYVRPRGELDEQRLRATLGQLLSGVHAIHAAGKVHRDLKPSNVLVTEEGRVVILDFGLLAAVQPGGEGQTLDEERRSGTPAYMAPEQAAGKSSSAASDYYALGVMLFEVLTGRLPFAGERYELLQRKQSERARLPSSIVKTLPEDLDTLCAGLLELEERARPTWSALERFAQAVDTPPAVKHAPALTGREPELAVLWRAFESAERGRATLVRVRGASGIGKSALVAAFLDGLRAESHARAVLLSGRCYGRQAVPYRAFDRVIDELTHQLRRMPPIECAALMPRDIAALCRIFPVLGHVEAFASAPERPAASEAELRLRAFDAFVELLARIRDRKGLVLHIDDLHWLDEDSVLLLEHLLAQEDPPPLLLLLAERDEAAQGEAPEAIARESALLARVQRAAEQNAAITRHVLELGPLAKEATQALAERLLEGLSDAAELARAVAEEADGNAFLASELSRHVARQRAQGGDASTHKPVSLEQAIEARVAPLGEGARRVLELLAVSARPVRGEVLVRAAREHAEGAQLALDALCAALLIRDGGGHVYECAHDRVRATVSERLPAAVLREHNAQLAAAWSERSDADPATLFELYLAAGDRAQAGRYALDAAQRAGAALGFERHARLLGHAIELLPAAESERLALRQRRAEALSNAGHWAQAAEAFEVARAEAERAGDSARMTRLGRDAALHFLGSGHGAQGLPRLREVLERHGIAWPERLVLLRAASKLIALWVFFGKRLLAPPANDDVASAQRGALSKDAERLERLFECAALVPPYDLSRGLYFMAAFVGRALKGPTDHPDRAALVSIAQAMLACMLATPPLTSGFARRLCAQAVELARAQPLPHLGSAALSLAGFARMQQGALDEALALGKEALTRLGDAQRAHVYEAWNARSVQALSLLTMGRLGEAAACFADNARLAREVGDGLARSGGDSALRHLVAHDLPQAHALIEHKRAALADSEGHGVLHEVARNERLLCALYEGRGAEALASGDAGSPLPLLFFDVSMLAACCALQAASSAPDAEREGARRQAMKSARSCLRRLPRNTAAGRASAAQLRAALLMLDADPRGAAAFARASGREYELAGMRLHAAIMRLREGELRGDDAAVQSAQKFMREQGVAQPDAWARMLAPGF
jgi:hypothetical protein